MAKSRPIGITILAILALLGALVAAYYAFQLFTVSTVGLFGGSVRFFAFGVLGAALWAIMFLIYLWVFRMLWNLDPQGWTFLAIISTLNLILALLSLFGESSLQEMLPSILITASF